MELINKTISNETSIAGKYKTIGELKNASTKSVIAVISRMKPSPERVYLSKWLFETYYLKKTFTGNLTNRIRNISNKCSYNHIVNHCFDGIDLLTNYKTINILNEKCKNIIEALHKIEPSGTGTFMDYLVRRIVNELRQEQFNDNRANCFTNLNGLNIKEKKKIKFLKKNNYCYNNK